MKRWLKSLLSFEPSDSELQRLKRSGLFDAAYYLAANPDVARSGMNPLLHYTEFGIKEGRRPLPPIKSGSYFDYARNATQQRANETPHHRAEIERFAVKPFFSIVVPVYNTPLDVLKKTLDSVRNQIYENWELCLVDDKSTNTGIADFLRECAANDPRIRVRFQEINGGISTATNAGFALARGDFVGLLDHDDELTEDALFWFARAIDARPETDILYSDQDIVGADGEPFGHMFKSAWSPEYFRGLMYLGHLVAVRKTLLDTVGGCDARFDGVQDFELELRLSERTEKIVHVPRVLYHWRALPNTTATIGSEKQARLQEAAVREHLARLNIPMRAERIGSAHRIRYSPQPRTTNPLVSILITPRNSATDTKRDMDRLLTKTGYRNIELIVPDGSLDGEIPEIIRQAAIPQESRLAALNTLAAVARGEYLIFFDLGSEPSQPDWIERLLMYAERPGIGMVGPRLDNRFGSTAGAGVTFDASGAPLDLHRGSPRDDDGYMGTLACSHETLAVRPTVAMLRASAFKEHGGFDTSFESDFAAFDLCFKLHTSGLRNMYAASVSMEADLDMDEHGAERRRFVERWAELLRRGDPYFNPNAFLSFDNQK